MRLHSLQYLRALASLFVVYGHAVLQVDDYFKHLIEFGGFGVDIFFVISGFIMVYIAKPDDNPKRFIINRARRVIPLYWFFTLLMAAILLTAPFLFKNTVYNTVQAIQSLLFIPFYSTAYPDMVWPIVAPGWSLTYEMYFYLIFALSLLLPMQQRILFISAIIVFVFAAAYALPQSGAVNQFFRDSIVLEFILGMALARAHQTGFRVPAIMAWLLIFTGLALLLIKFELPRIITWGVPSLSVVIGVLYSRLPANRFFISLGDSSYALYLSHIFTLGLCRATLPALLGEGPQAAYQFVAISIVMCIVVGYLAHYLVDNWLLRAGRRDKFRRLFSRSAHSN